MHTLVYIDNVEQSYNTKGRAGCSFHICTDGGKIEERY